MPTPSGAVDTVRSLRTLAERRFGTTLLLAVGAGAAVVGLLAYRIEALAPLEDASLDTRFAVRGADRPRDVVLVLIDEPSLAGTSWPIPLATHARAIRRIAAGSPRAIAYGVVFVDERPGADALVSATRSAGGRVVLPAPAWNSDGSNGVFGGTVGQRNGRVSVGGSRLGTDGRAVVRRVAPDLDGLPEFAVAAAAKALGRRVDHSGIGSDGAWIDFRGPPGTFASVSFGDVLTGRVAPARFHAKIVVVGSAAASVQSPFATPTTTGELMWGPEVIANELWTALHGFPLRDAGMLVDAIAIVLLALAIPLASLRLPFRWTVLLALGLAAGWLVGVQLAFERGSVVTVVYPLAALGLATVGTVGARYALAAFDRQRVRDTFRRFVPEQVVDELLSQSGDALRLGGIESFGTVMFTDIRGFTSFSEPRPAAEVIDVLNRYFGELSDAVLGHGGTLVSFSGDGLMAVFGAPIEQPDHADRALATAREILDERLPRFNGWLVSAGGGRPFRIGVGLNSGTFASGNVGSERRLEYTAIGDTINTAARLEGLTKESGSQLLLSEQTRGALVDVPADLVYIGELDVRGRRKRVAVWSLASEAPPSGDVDADERT